MFITRNRLDQLGEKVKKLDYLFEANKRWAEGIRDDDPDFFERLSGQQHPEYLWIGCADSRVPANQIVNLPPGEVFVHRNIANVVVHTDLNCLSVINYGVQALGVKHIIVCGHYGCGGVKAAMTPKGNSLTDNWLRHIKDIIRLHKSELLELPEAERADRLCELNVIEQVRNVCNTSIVREAWRSGAELSVHGWIYDIRDGRLRDLDVCFSSEAQFSEQYPPAGLCS